MNISFTRYTLLLLLLLLACNDILSLVNNGKQYDALPRIHFAHSKLPYFVKNAFQAFRAKQQQLLTRALMDTQGRETNAWMNHPILSPSRKQEIFFKNDYGYKMNLFILFESVDAMNEYIRNRQPNRWLEEISNIFSVSFVVLLENDADENNDSKENENVSYMTRGIDKVLDIFSYVSPSWLLSSFRSRDKLVLRQVDDLEKGIDTEMDDMSYFTTMTNLLTKAMDKKRVYIGSCRLSQGYRSDGIKIEKSDKVKMILMFMMECLNSYDDSSIAVLSDTIYVDPFSLYTVMLSLTDSKYNPILTMENNAVLTNARIWKNFLSEAKRVDGYNKILKSFLKQENSIRYDVDIKRILSSLNIPATVITTLNEATERNLIEPKDGLPPSHGDFSQISGSRLMMIWKQHYAAQRGLFSCSLPNQKALSFSEYVTSTFKRCMFVAGIRENYEPHAIRFLQRMSRGKVHEVKWDKDQIIGNEKRKCDIAIGVTSRITNVWERMLVRRTWGLVARSIGTVQLYFLFGSPNKKLNEEEEKNLDYEMKHFKDIVVLPTKEGYFQMFNKVMAWFGWGYENTTCSTIMKIDPDTYVRMFPLMKFLIDHNVIPLEKSHLPSGKKEAGVYFGTAIWNATSIKNSTDRWYFYDKWPHEILPTFMSGAMFGLSRPLASYVYEHRFPDMRLDDPGVGAILMKLKEKDSDLVRYETSESEWYPSRPCTVHRIYENPYYKPHLSLNVTFKKDLFGQNYCSNDEVDESRLDLGSIDGIPKYDPATKQMISSIKNDHIKFDWFESKSIGIAGNNVGADSNRDIRIRDDDNDDAAIGIHPSDVGSQETFINILSRNQKSEWNITMKEIIMMFICPWLLMIYLAWRRIKLRRIRGQR